MKTRLKAIALKEKYILRSDVVEEFDFRVSELRRLFDKLADHLAPRVAMLGAVDQAVVIENVCRDFCNDMAEGREPLGESK